MRLGYAWLVLVSILLAACAPAPAVSTPTVVSVASTPSTTVPTAGPSSAPTAAAPQSGVTQCNNPFYPVSATARWQYRNTIAGLSPSTFAQSDTNITSNSFSEHREFPDLKTDTGWTCGADGSLMSAQFGNLNTSSTQFQLQTTKNTGVTIPAPKDWKAGTTWNNNYEVKGTMKLSNATVNTSGSIDVNYSIAGQESLTVPAGTYNAFKLTSDATMKLTVNSNGINMPINITISTNAWFAQNVGMLKSQSSTQGIESSLELLSFTP